MLKMNLEMVQLVNMVIVLHEAFLKSNGFKSDKSEIKCWHSKFDLDIVSDIWGK